MTFNILQWFKKNKKTETLTLQAAIDHGVAERSAISVAVCAGMADGSFYRNPKGIVAGARARYKKQG